MHISKGLIMKLFSANDIQRWNDKIRPIELNELDKQAHKMIIAYYLGKFEDPNKYDWDKIIKYGFFDLLERIEVTDIKPSIYYKIKEDPTKASELNNWVYKRLTPVIEPLGNSLMHEFKDYISNTDSDLNMQIIRTAHIVATKWEFQIIKLNNPNDTEIPEINNDLISRLSKYPNVKGIEKANESNFIKLCGQLRFQKRWGASRRVTFSSVLGHMLLVGYLSYLYAIANESCQRLCINNFFTGLFHDFPEVLTRDIISPVKNSTKDIPKIVHEYEQEQLYKKVYGELEPEILDELKLYIDNEFNTSISSEDKSRKTVTEHDLYTQYNENKYDPIDGGLIKACDELAAFVEAYIAVENGATSNTFQEAIVGLKNKYLDKKVSKINFSQIYADFD